MRFQRSSSVLDDYRTVEVIREPQVQYKIHRTPVRAASVALGEDFSYSTNRRKPSSSTFVRSWKRADSVGNLYEHPLNSVMTSTHYHSPRTRAIHPSRSYGVSYLSYPLVRRSYNPWDRHYIDVESFEKTNRIRSRQEGLLNYEPAPLDFYNGIKQNLREISNKLNVHRQLIDRYSSIDMDSNKSVSQSIDEKCQEIMDRMPASSRLGRVSGSTQIGQSRPPTYKSSAGVVSQARSRIRQALAHSRR